MQMKKVGCGFMIWPWSESSVLVRRENSNNSAEYALGEYVRMRKANEKTIDKSASYIG